MARDMEKVMLVITSDRIDLYEDTAREFFRRVLGRDYDECFVTDISELSDYGPMVEELSESWDAAIIARVRLWFGVHLDTTCVSLVDLFEQIEQKRSTRVH